MNTISQGASVEIRQVGVIGAGVIGTGVAQSLAEVGYQVVLVDLTREILDRAIAEIRNSLRLTTLLRKQLHDSLDATLSRIRGTTDCGEAASTDVVIENVTESWVIKKEVYERLDAVCAPQTIFVANTSAISITRIASITRRPKQVVGIHFMNPVPLKSTVELIRGVHTSTPTLDIATALLTRMGKQWVVVSDLPGFVSNRVMMLTINEAACVLQDNVASAEDIDRIFKSCFAHKMGPLEMADLIGLDTVLNSIEVLYDSYRDCKYRPCPLLRRMVDAGLFGRKSGRGFYEYSQGAR